MENNEKLPKKQWYIVTTYSGNENKVKENIERRTESMNLQDYVKRVIVAEQDVEVIDSKTGLQKVRKNKVTGLEEPVFKTVNLYPGYVFVEMIMTDESWYMVRNTPLVTGIAGSSGGGQKPTPVPGTEIERVLKAKGIVDESMYASYKNGDTVKIIDGPFKGIDGRIIEINQEVGSVKIDAVFFGRHTQIEVDFSKIVKA